MKFNFRKIASVLTSAVMLSSTVAVAAAANFPAPFVSGGEGTYAIVHGAGTQGTDGVAALNLNTWLLTKVTTPSTTVVTNTTPTDGDFVLLERTNNKFNLGEATNSFQSSLDVEDLPTVLADGVYTNDPGTDFEYTQKIVMGGDMQLNWQQDNLFNDRKPFVGFDVANGKHLLNYSLEFKTNAEGVDTSFSKLKNTVINILGRDYYISNAVSTGNGAKLTLLDTANSLRITEGDTQTLTVGNESIKIKVVGISGSGTDAAASLEVNNVELSSDLKAGETAKVRGSNVYVGVKKLTTSSRESTPQSAVITVGTGQIVIENGQEVQLNAKSLSSLDQYNNWMLKAYIVNVTTNVKSLTLEWNTNDKVALMPGQSWTMPAFEGVKLSMGDFVTPTAEETTFQDSSDSVQISTEIKDGTVSFSPVYTNTTSVIGAGSDATDLLVTNPLNSTTQSLSLNTENGTFFAATWISGVNAETYMFKLKSIGSSSDNNKTTLTNLVDGKGDLVIGGVGDEKDYGSVTFKVLAASSSSRTATIQIKTNAGGNVYTDRIATKKGLVIGLPNATALVSGPTTWTTTMTEANADNDNIGTGASFTASFVGSTDGAKPSTVTNATLYASERNSDLKIGYVISPLATYVALNKPDTGAGDLTVKYHSDESYGQVYVTESKVTFNEEGGSNTGTLVVTDAEVQSVSGKNLIVVGGSCVNTVAAKLLNSNTPLCEAAWTSATTAGAGAFLIQTFANPYTPGKVATLVAGYDAPDTENAVNALKTRSRIVAMSFCEPRSW